MPLVTIEEGADTIEITLNRPGKRNALNIEILETLADQLDTLHEEETKGVLLRGAGPVTCAGADTSVVRDGTEDENRRFRNLTEEVYELLSSYPRPTVMACKGAAVGAGFQLTVICDFTILGGETVLYKPEIDYGLFSEYATKMIEHEAGANVARDITLTGDELEPERAVEFGLAKAVVPNDEVDDRAQDLLDQLVEFDNEAYRRAKESLRFNQQPSDFEGYP